MLREVARVAFDDVAHLLRPRPPGPAPQGDRRPRGVAERPLRGARAAAQRLHRGRPRAAGVPGHRHRDRHGPQGRARPDLRGRSGTTLSQGVFDAYEQRNLRYSQMAPRSTCTPRRTPARTCRRRSRSTPSRGTSTSCCSSPRGAGSANKSFLYQETKALLNPASLLRFVEAKLKTIGTAACPPYHLALVVGGTSAEFTLKTLKLATTKYLDRLPSSGNEHGRAFRDHDLEDGVLRGGAADSGSARSSAASTFAHDVRVIRLPRHGGVVSRRPGRLLLGGPAGAGEDHARGGLPGATRGEPVPLPSGRHRGRAAGRRRPHRSEPADAGDPRRADQVSGRDPAVAVGSHESWRATSRTPS